MLRLSRRAGQTIVFRTPEGVEIRILIEKIREHVAYLTFDIPDDVVVIRGEIAD